MAPKVLVTQLVHIIDRFAMAMRVVQIAPTSIIEEIGSGIRAKAVFKIELKMSDQNQKCLLTWNCRMACILSALDRKDRASSSCGGSTSCAATDESMSKPVP